MNQRERNPDCDTIGSIDCIAMLFWNHTDSDIQFLRKSSSNIDHIWSIHIDSTGETYTALWKAWLNKFTDDSKRIIADYAVRKFSNADENIFPEY